MTAVRGSALGLAIGVASGVIAAVGVAVGAGVAVGSGVGAAKAPAVGLGVRVGRAVGFGVGFGVALGVGLGVGFGVAVGTAEILTVPAARLASLLSFARDEMATVCVPTGSVPDQRNVTPCPHEPPATRDIDLFAPPMRAVTLSARDPLLFL
jgi:hypothetical protein